MIVMYSRNGSSDLSAVGARSNDVPVAAGDQRFIFAPSSLQPAAPCTISIATRRVASVPAAAPFRRLNALAGSIASRNGRAKVAPIPRTKVRRGSGLSVRISIVEALSGSRRTARFLLVVVRRGGRHARHAECVALHDAENEVVHAEAVRLS